MRGARVALCALGAGRGWLSMLCILPIYHRRLELQKAVAGPEIGVATAYSRPGCRCPPARMPRRVEEPGPLNVSVQISVRTVSAGGLLCKSLFLLVGRLATELSI